MAQGSSVILALVPLVPGQYKLDARHSVVGNATNLTRDARMCGEEGAGSGETGTGGKTKMIAYSHQIPIPGKLRSLPDASIRMSSSIAVDKNPPRHPSSTATRPIEVTESPFPDWEYGQGVLDGVSRFNFHTEIDPYASTRETVSNYRFLISAITPRPIEFVSTVSASLAKYWEVVENLAPFSYFQLVDHDPPMLILGFSGRPGREKDTFRNLKETGDV
ncbi:hypothetical protein AN4356.2 [Aspergillus nidulans FGSC A4]|uniref:Uncharacterized protein n=1 Tax=Emericella nidulans (strain FGSC A4 / ATCC 38163 / CBS 112.46 / NRRL 194 / M139) TaxID=227321 RepID=Q5B524_EMENI|nr:hypothetical protein [Aspergillus nidulans FGSC A4]EAA60517.1 hypothetical protein AN4356.2 [Aspergillus nidulans FGSC A4]CBF77692.1 TPA: hypothetical protein ANIA_04356 [Aspergillus nidulans FGSC A4]|eukprot:XP_661960.1 hypothetical protein AN4356.2 [Aspergillus nidulans FGSC A4]